MDSTDWPSWLQAISAVVGLLVAAAAVLIALNQTRIAREQVRISAELNDLSKTQTEFAKSQAMVNEEQLKISHRLESIEARRDRPLPVPSKLTLYPRQDRSLDLDLRFLNVGGGAVVNMVVKSLSAVLHTVGNAPKHIWIIEEGRGLRVGTFVTDHSETIQDVTLGDPPLTADASLTPSGMEAEFVDALTGELLAFSWHALRGFEVNPLQREDITGPS